MWLPRLWSSRREGIGNGNGPTMASGFAKDHASQRMAPQGRTCHIGVGVNAMVEQPIIHCLNPQVP